MFSNPSRVHRIGARRGVARCGSVRERLLKDGVVAVGLAASRRRPVLEDQSVGGTRADGVTALEVRIATCLGRGGATAARHVLGGRGVARSYGDGRRAL